MIGEREVVSVNAFDYSLMRAIIAYAVDAESSDPVHVAMRRYLKDEISLSKAAELLGTNRWDLSERFQRLGVPLRIGPATIEEAREEVETLRRLRELNP